MSLPAHTSAPSPEGRLQLTSFCHRVGGHLPAAPWPPLLALPLPPLTLLHFRPSADPPAGPSGSSELSETVWVACGQRVATCPRQLWISLPFPLQLLSEGQGGCPAESFPWPPRETERNEERFGWEFSAAATASLLLSEGHLPAIPTLPPPAATSPGSRFSSSTAGAGSNGRGQRRHERPVLLGCLRGRGLL